jgi:hypothetical protein
MVSKAIYHAVKPFIALWHDILESQEHALALKEKGIAVAEKGAEST